MKTNAKQLLALVRLEPLTSREEATALAVETARLDLERDRAAVIRDERIEALKLEFDLQIESFTAEIERNTKRLQVWAVTNRPGEFGEKKSVTLAGHLLAFREGTGKVEFVPGTKADDALDMLLAHEDPAVTERFVSVAPSLNKNAIIQAWKGSQTFQGQLAACGITVVKEEKFSFSPNRDAVPEIAPVAVGKVTV